jgi:hypothetical protein
MRTCAAPTIFRHSEPMGHANVRPMAGSPSNFAAVQEWIASSLALLAMTIIRDLTEPRFSILRRCDFRIRAGVRAWDEWSKSCQSDSTDNKNR